MPNFFVHFAYWITPWVQFLVFPQSWLIMCTISYQSECSLRICCRSVWQPLFIWEPKFDEVSTLCRNCSLVEFGSWDIGMCISINLVYLLVYLKRPNGTKESREENWNGPWNGLLTCLSHLQKSYLKIQFGEGKSNFWRGRRLDTTKLLLICTMQAVTATGLSWLLGQLGI